MKYYKQLIGWILLSILAIIPFRLSAKEKAEDSPLNNYSITGTGRTGNQGTYLVKVSVTTSNSKLADKEIAKCAVHGVIFHGFSGHGTHHERPLAKSNAEEEHFEFFKDFFNTQAAGYASTVPSSRQVTKISKKEYQITEIVEVQKDRLKKTLSDAGVIRNLNSGF